jgi:hypothetical protein
MTRLVLYARLLLLWGWLIATMAWLTLVALPVVAPPRSPYRAVVVLYFAIYMLLLLYGAVVVSTDWIRSYRRGRRPKP